MQIVDIHALSGEKKVPFSVIKQWHFSVEGFILTHENNFSNFTQLKVATDKTVEEI